jgi:type II secretory pathway pseudopilin PulG
MTRRGIGLPELLVTLVLGVVVMAAASRTLVQHLRQQRDRDAQARADNVVREVHDVLRAELSHASGDLRVLGDTAVEIASVRIVALACDLSSTRLVVPGTQAWWSPPRAGDSLAVIDTLTHGEWRTAIAATATQRPSANCPDGGTRLTLVTAPPASVPPLRLPVRVWRVARYIAYRASDGLWWLGERTCAPGCGSAQPIAGPLLPPSQGGLRLALLTAVDGRQAALDVSVRAGDHARVSALFARLPVAAFP